jgi:ectoine hydroxylase-related dioxygenase (phytanoyl-CoA dioxygenase family)
MPALTPEQLASFSTNGYVIVPALFTADETQRISQLAHEIEQETRQFEVEGDTDVAKNLKGTHVVLTKRSESQNAIKRVVWAAAAKPELLTYGRSPNVLEPVSQLLYSSEADHLINQIHYKNSNDGVEFPWHQDLQNRMFFDKKWQDINLKGSFVQTLAAIDPCTNDNGPLNVLPASHSWGFLEFSNFLKTEDLQKLLDSKNIIVDVISSQVPLLMSPGDVAFMHPLLIHGSWANKSAQSRRMFINGFSYPGANHSPYPGVGSTKRISLTTGLEVIADSKPISNENPGTTVPRSISTSRLALLATKKAKEVDTEVTCDLKQDMQPNI